MYEVQLLATVLWLIHVRQLITAEKNGGGGGVDDWVDMQIVGKSLQLAQLSLLIPSHLLNNC